MDNMKLLVWLWIAVLPFGLLSWLFHVGKLSIWWPIGLMLAYVVAFVVALVLTDGRTRP
jgi:membrane protein YdbS with pleckstrin-like domain